MRGRIFIVEDDADLQAILGHFLKSQGYEVISALDGREALEKMEVGQFDLLIVDLAMPKVDGWTVIKEVRQRSGNRTLPVIVLSAHDFPRDQAKAFQAGCNEFLAKPFNPDELLKKIQDLLGPSTRGPSSKPPTH